MPIVSIDRDKCVDCGQCALVCPLDVLRMEAGEPKIRFPEDCQSCYLCVNYCATDAIKVTADRNRPTPLPW